MVSSVTIHGADQNYLVLAPGLVCKIALAC